MTKKNIHTVFNKQTEKWDTKREGQKEPLASSNTKLVAQEKSTKQAKKDGVEHVIHNKDGKISDKDSYGKDPYPPKDRKF